MIRTPMLCAVVPLAALAEAPVFEDLSANLPTHQYEGDWTHFVGGGVAVFDCNGDMRPDFLAAGGANPALLAINAGSFTFVTTPMPELTAVTGAYPINIDGDAFTDLFVLRAGQNVVLKGGPDCTFADATDAWGIPTDTRWSTAFSAWWNDDTRPTLAIGNYVDRSNPLGPFEACDDNILLVPDQAGFTTRLLTPGYCPLSLLAAQDARGVMALRLSNDRHYYVKGGYEQMWDIAEERFLGPDDGWQNVSLWGMGIASRDLNGDGRDEVMLTSMGDQLMQLAQPDGTYSAAPYAIGTYAQRPHIGDDGRPSTGWHAEFADVNNDGLVDLFIAKGNVDQMPGLATRDPNNLLVQQSDGSFAETAAEAGVAATERSRGAALADFDGDGRLDLIVVNRRASLELYRNLTPNVGNWISIRLRQGGGNVDAIGAVIEVETDVRQSVQNTIGGGHAGGQLLPRHFGLGAAAEARVIVNWPDGSQSTHEVTANQTVTLEKP